MSAIAIRPNAAAAPCVAAAPAPRSEASPAAVAVPVGPAAVSADVFGRDLNAWLDTQPNLAPDLRSEAAARVAVRELDRALTRITALKLHTLAAAERLNVASPTGAAGTSAWLSSVTRQSGAAAASQVRLATALDERLPLTAAAVQAGDVSTDHAHVIANATQHLPADTPTALVERVEATLVATARRATPARLRQAAQRAVRAAEQEAAALAKTAGAGDEALRSEEELAWQRSSLTLHDNTDGTMTGHFTVPTHAGQMLRRVIQQLAAPSRTHEPGCPLAHPKDAGAGPALGTHAAASAGAALGADPAAVDSQRPGDGDDLNRVTECDCADKRPKPGTQEWRAIDWRQRYGHALVDILEHLPTDRIHGKTTATIVVTCDLDTLTTQLDDAGLLGSAQADVGQAGDGVGNTGQAHTRGAKPGRTDTRGAEPGRTDTRGAEPGRTDTGDVLSASQVRRLACEAGIVPVILDGESLPLDLGRTKRYFTEAQRVALATKYTECAAEGCDRPYAWTHLHHLNPWAHGGHTNLNLAVPCCGHHHRRMHDPAYEHHIHEQPRNTRSVTFHRRP